MALGLATGREAAAAAAAVWERVAAAVPSALRLGRCRGLPLVKCQGGPSAPLATSSRGSRGAGGWGRRRGSLVAMMGVIQTGVRRRTRRTQTRRIFRLRSGRIWRQATEMPGTSPWEPEEGEGVKGRVRRGVGPGGSKGRVRAAAGGRAARTSGAGYTPAHPLHATAPHMTLRHCSGRHRLLYPSPQAMVCP